MKILHLISSSGMYGAEAVILSLMRTLAGGPNQSALGVFINPALPNVQLYERALSEGMETHAIECRGQVDRAVPAALRALVERSGADLAHAHGYKADVYLYVALRGRGIPIVSTCHTWYDNDLLLWLYGGLDRFVLRSFSRVAAVSGEVRRRLLRAGVREGRIELIRNGIDLGAFESRPHREQGLCVGLVGRLDREKGIDIFLHAVVQVLKAEPLARFSVAGDGPDRAKLQALIEELGIGANVALLGRQEDMRAFYSSLDLMVSSSRQEGLPIALLEGMASGLPLVATAVGEVPSLVRHGETGLLIEPENIEALATAVVKLLREPLLRERYGAAARARIANEFSAERMAAGYMRLYEHACEER